MPTNEITAYWNRRMIVCFRTRPLLSWGSQIIACHKVKTQPILKCTSYIPQVIFIFAIFQATPIDLSIVCFHAFAGTIEIIYRSGFCPQYLSLKQTPFTFDNCKTIQWKDQMQLILSFYKDCRENKVTNRSNLQIKLKFVHASFREDGKTGEGENGQRKTSQKVGGGRGGNQKIQKGVGRGGSYKDTIYFGMNSLK